MEWTMEKRYELATSIDNEGFSYFFINSVSSEWIQQQYGDEKLTGLAKKFEEAGKELENYLIEIDAVL